VADVGDLCSAVDALLTNGLDLKTLKTQTIAANQNGGWLSPNLMQACVQNGYMFVRACFKIAYCGREVLTARSRLHQSCVETDVGELCVAVVRLTVK
jgi:hypothetical protein